MKQRPREFWASLVREFEHANLTQSDFALQHRVPLATFRYWLYKLRQEVQAPQHQSLRFIEVTSSNPAPPPQQLALVLTSGHQLQFSALPPASYLAELLQHLSASPC